jgi:hypothetical protein
MRINLILEKGFDLKKYTGAGLRPARATELATRLSGIPRVGEYITCDLPRNYEARQVSGDVVFVGYSARAGLLRFFFRPSVTVSLAGRG